MKRGAAARTGPVVSIRILVCVVAIAVCGRVPKKDGMCCKQQAQFAGRQLFSGVTSTFTPDELIKFVKDNKARDTKGQGDLQIMLSDKSRISRVSSADPNCYSAFPFYLEKRDANGQIVLRRSLVYWNATPITQSSKLECDMGNGTDVKEIATTDTPRLVKLEDDTLLVYGIEGNYVIRFNSDLEAQQLPSHVFIVDTSVIDDFRSRFRPMMFPKSQQMTIDAVVQYLKGGDRKKK